MGPQSLQNFPDLQSASEQEGGRSHGDDGESDQISQIASLIAPKPVFFKTNCLKPCTA